MLLEPRLTENNGYFLSLSSTDQYRTEDDKITPDTPLDKSSFILMVIAVILVPIACTFLLCMITYCVYRYNRQSTARRATNAPIASNNRSDPRIATVIYNTQHSPFIYEESPPSYESLGDIKKTTSNRSLNPNEQYPLTILPNPTLTDTNETSTVAVISPTAPTPPPPSYQTLEHSNRT